MTRAVTLAEIADTNTFIVDGANVRVGINSSIPTTTLDVGGAVKATSFTGDGSSLTGVASTDNIITGTAATFTSNVNISGITTVGVLTAYTSVTVGAAITADAASGIVTATTFSGALTGNVTGNASGSSGSCSGNSATATVATNAQGLTGTPDITVRNIIGVGATLSGILTYEDVTNIDSVGIVTARLGIKVGAGQSISAVSGIITYYGDGSQLTGISAGISTTASSPSANTIVTLNLSTAQHHDLTLTAGITTITCSGGSFGDSHSVVISQPSSGIATVGFSTFFLFPSGATPSMSEGSSKVDLVSFVVKRVGVGGTQLLASAGLNYN